MTEFTVRVGGEIMTVHANTITIVPDIIRLHLEYKHSLKPDTDTPFQMPGLIQILGVG